MQVSSITIGIHQMEPSLPCLLILYFGTLNNMFLLLVSSSKLIIILRNLIKSHNRLIWILSLEKTQKRTRCKYLDEDVFPIRSFSTDIHNGSYNSPCISQLNIHLCSKILGFVCSHRKDNMFRIILWCNSTHIPKVSCCPLFQEGGYPIFMYVASARIL
jgi:hypothetical protein